MQRMSWIIALLMIVSVTACSSSSEPMAVEFVDPMSAEAGAAGVSGAAVDKGIVCATGSFETLRMEKDGNPVSDDEGGRLWEEAMESGATIRMVLYEEFNCSDGSGSISLVVDNVVQPSALDFEGSNDVGTWEIQGGTGSYEKHSGTGAYRADFGSGLFYYSGEIQEG